jgi:hypothetical protein
MNRRFVVTAVFSTFFAVANAQVNSSTNGSLSSTNSASASKSGASVQSGTSASASNETSISAAKSNGSANGNSSQIGKGSHEANASSSGALNAGTTMNAVLAKPVDSKKAKPGDQVVATTSRDVKAEGRTVIPKGSKLVGHITEAQARGEGAADSSLGIMFDHAVLKNGQQVPVHGVVQALAAGQADTSAAMGDDNLNAMGSTATTGTGAVRSGGGLLGGVGSTVNTATSTVANTNAVTGVATSATGSVAGSGRALQGALNSSSTGVIGLHGLSLESVAANSAQGNIISSTGKSVHLDSGTQMVLRVVSQ